MSGYRIKTSKAFRKDIRRLQKSQYAMEKLQAVIDLLAAGQDLPESYFDHALRGDAVGQRECHIGPDWVLTYRKDHKLLLLLLLRTGTHRDVLRIE